MSDPLDQLKPSPHAKSVNPSSDPIVAADHPKTADKQIIVGSLAAIAAALLTGKYKTAATAFTFATTFRPTPKAPFLRPTPFTGLLLWAPLPFGFGPSEHHSLRANYMGRFLENDLGISRKYFPEAAMFATQPDSPAIEARFHEAMRRKVYEDYERKALHLGFGQLRSDYYLFTRLARGELGEVPIQLDAERLRAIAIDAYNLKLSHLQYFNLGAIQTYSTPPLAEVPILPPQGPTTTAPIRPVISAGGGGDYGGGGPDPLGQAEHGDRTIRTAVGPSDPLPAPPRPRPNKPSAPSSALQQEAYNRAPPILRELVGERADP